MSTPSVIAVHFGQKEAGSTQDGEPVMVDQRVYIGHKWAGELIAVALRDFLCTDPRLANDEEVTAELTAFVAEQFLDDRQGSGITLAPYPVSTQHLVLVLDATNERVWVEDREGVPVRGREWTITQFAELTRPDAMEVVQE